MASVSLDTPARMLLGTDIAAVNAILEALPCDVVGMNCSTGPDYMRDAVRYLAAHSSKYISCIPNAGIPRNEGGLAIYPLEPAAMRDQLRAFVADFGVHVVGGCCGSGPEHIRLLVEATAGLRPRTPKAVAAQEIASAMTSLALEQEPRPLIVGERLNAQGSRKVKRLILSDDYDALVEVAREQVSGGAHALDVCMALTEREGEDEAMAEVVKRLELSVEAPLMIDSTSASHQARARDQPGPRHHQFRQFGERPEPDRRRAAARDRTRRRCGGAHHRKVGRHGENRRRQGIGGAPDRGDVLR
jgi:5-methyltetrahydrofolate--homocysteine methyltransferase